MKNVSVWGYDAEAEAFTVHRFFDTGWSDVAHVWIDEDTYVWLFDSPVGITWRWTMVEESPNVWSNKMERSEKGGPWEVYRESRWTNTKVR